MSLSRCNTPMRNHFRGRHFVRDPLRWAFVGCCILGLIVSPAVADSPARPSSYQRVVGADDEFVFVMLADEMLAGSQGQIYTRSGLYRNDGSVIPLWTVSGYSFNVDVSDDGRYLVRYGPWASGLSQLAVSFHDRGRPVRAYSINDLITDAEQLQYTVSHFFWESGKEFDGRRHLLKMGTLSGDTYLFDITTGIIIASLHSPSPVAATMRGDDAAVPRLEQVHVCWSDTLLIGWREYGALPSVLKLDGVALGSVARMQRIPPHQLTATRFEITLANGELRQLEFSAPPPLLCGTAADGRAVVVPLESMELLVVER